MISDHDEYDEDMQEVLNALERETHDGPGFESEIELPPSDYEEGDGEEE